MSRVPHAPFFFLLTFSKLLNSTGSFLLSSGERNALRSLRKSMSSPASDVTIERFRDHVCGQRHCQIACSRTLSEFRRDPASPSSIVSLDWPFDDLGFLSEKFRQMLFYVVGSQTHRLISTSPVLKHADGRALAVASIKPIVTHKPLRILNDWYEFLAYLAVNFCTVLWIKVIMTNNGEHDASPSFNFPVSILFREDDSVRPLSCQPRIGQASSKNAVNFSSARTRRTRSIAMRVNNPNRSPVL